MFKNSVIWPLEPTFFLFNTVFPACVPLLSSFLPQILLVQALLSALGYAVAKTDTKACPQGAAG